MLRLYLFKLAFRIKGLSPAHLGPTPFALYLTMRAYGIVVEPFSYIGDLTAPVTQSYNVFTMLIGNITP
nr:MAG TPA: hypothetical protein [Caudoviricetes sp.]